jgi:hypothetical protein
MGEHVKMQIAERALVNETIAQGGPASMLGNSVFTRNPLPRMAYVGYSAVGLWFLERHNSSTSFSSKFLSLRLFL